MKKNDEVWSRTLDHSYLSSSLWFLSFFTSRFSSFIRIYLRKLRLGRWYGYLCISVTKWNSLLAQDNTKLTNSCANNCIFPLAHYTTQLIFWGYSYKTSPNKNAPATERPKHKKSKDIKSKDIKSKLQDVQNTKRLSYKMSQVSKRLKSKMSQIQIVPSLKTSLRKKVIYFLNIDVTYCNVGEC
jgi:hypothetical protein